MLKPPNPHLLVWLCTFRRDCGDGWTGGGVVGMQETVKGADILIFCAPHQFVHGICKQLMGKINPDAIAISLTKVSAEFP